MNKISFIIIEYNSYDDICKCINKIKTYMSNSYEIIVSSNSCYLYDQESNLLEENVIWINNRRNGGFAYAMNQGLDVASGEILVIMNPDVKIKGGIYLMAKYLLEHPNVGVIGPRIENSHGIIQDSFRHFINPLNFITRHFMRLINKETSITCNKIDTVDWIIGAFMMFSRNTYETVGRLDEKYFLYCEDMDFCTRMYKEGLHVVYYPEAIVEYEGTRSARKSLKYTRIFITSLLHYWRKFGFFVTRK